MEMNFDERLLEGLRVDPAYSEPVLHQALRIAVYDEFHAYETYRKTVDIFGNVPPFSNIMEAEVRHFDALIPLLDHYGVPLPVNNWYEKIELPATLRECCEVGVAAEIENIRMYDDLLRYVGAYPDIRDVFFRLQAASNNHHLPAFRACVQRLADADGIGRPDMPPDANAAMAEKINTFSDMAQKFAAGEVSQEDLLKVLGNTNLSFLGGLLLGAAGAAMLTKMLNENPEKKEV